MKQTLLFILPNLQGGGAERSLVNLLQLMDYERFAVDLLLFQPSGMFLTQLPPQVRLCTDQQALQALYHPARARRLPLRRRLGYGAARWLGTGASRLLRGHGARGKQFRWQAFYSRLIPPLPLHYDVAVAYLQGEPLYYLTEKVQAARKLAWLHNEYPKTGLDAGFDLPHYRRVDQVVTITQACAQGWRAQFPALQEKLCVLPNLTSADTVRRMADAGTAPELDSAQPNLVSIGRLHPQKGFDLAIETARVLRARGVAFQWYILGTGTLHKALREHARRAGVACCVHFLGSRRNPYPYLKAADVVVQPSRFEGRSIVLDEAKILAKPILATAYATVGDQLTAQEGLTAPMTPEALADGILHMLAHGQAYAAYLRTQPYGNVGAVAAHLALLGAPPKAAVGRHSPEQGSAPEGNAPPSPDGQVTL